MTPHHFLVYLFIRSRRGTADSPPCQGGDSRSITDRDRHFRTTFPCEVKQPSGLLSRVSSCESMWGSQFHIIIESRPQGVTDTARPASNR